MFVLLAVSPTLPSAKFFLKPEVILRGGALGQGEPARCSGLASTRDLTRVMGQQELPSHPEQVSGDFILLNNLHSITLSSGSSKPEGTSRAAKAHLGLAQARLGGRCISSRCS